MSKVDYVSAKGEIVELLRDKFRVKLENDVIVTAYLAGRLRKNHIKVLLGDTVDVELSIYDISNARISYRYK